MNAQVTDQEQLSPTTYYTEAYEERVVLPRTRLQGWLIFLVFSIVYGVIGYFTVVSGHVVQFDSLERLNDAYMVWWNDPPKLAAIGLNLAPIGSLAFLPLTLVKPLATSLTALPIVSAMAAAGTLAMLNSTLARCEVAAVLRYLILVLFGLNPMFVWYAVNGSPETIGVFMTAAAVLAIISWRISDETRYLIGAGFAMSLAVLTDYTFLLWALGFFIAIAIIGPGPRGGQAKLRASLLLYATPVVYALLVWTVLNGLILDSPFDWVSTGADQIAANLIPGAQQAGTDFGSAMGDLAEMVLGVAPLAYLVLPLLLISLFVRRDTLALGLVVAVLLGLAAIVGAALIEDRAHLVSLSGGLPVAAAALGGAAWLFRGEDGWRFIVGTGMVIVLIIGIPLSWNAMRNYDHQDQADAFTRFVEDRDSQEGTRSIGGYEVGIDPELAMADYIDNELEPADHSILTDDSLTYGVILLTGKPQKFVDRADVSNGEWLALRDDPFGEVDYMLVATQARADQIRSNYTDLDLGVQPGLTPLFRTDRYVLVEVARTRPRTQEEIQTQAQARNQPTLTTPVQPASPPAASEEGEAGAGTGLQTSPGLGPDASLSPLPENSGSAAEPQGGGGTSAPTVVGE